jgi:hypothetical protein
MAARLQWRVTFSIMLVMQTYKASYQWTQEELLRVMRHHYRTNLRPGIVIAANIFSVLLAALSLFILVATGVKSLSDASPLMFIVFAVYWIFLRQKVTRWWVSRGFSERPDANFFIEWEISEEKINTRCEGLASSELHWKLFVRIVEASDGFLFYLHKNRFQWLPFSAFEQTEGIEKIRQFAKANGVQYVRTAG